MTVFKQLASVIVDKPSRQFDRYMECITAFQSQMFADNMATATAFLQSAVSDDTMVNSIPVSVVFWMYLLLPTYYAFIIMVL